MCQGQWEWVRLKVTGTHLGQLLHLLIVILKETQVLIRHIHSNITPKSLVFLLRSSPSRERMGSNLFMNLFRFIRHEDGRILVGSRHLRVGALERREELRVEEAGFLIA